MKNTFFSVIMCIVLSLCTCSCGTLFTSSKQEVTFKGVPGTDIYESNGKRLGEIGKNGFANLRVKKKIGSKQINARLDGYASRDVAIKSKFNGICALNLIFPVPWIIDLATGKVCKYSGDVVDVTLMPIDLTKPEDEDYEETPIPSDDGWIN